MESSSTIEKGVSNVLVKTVLRRLPAPLNLVAPLVVEKALVQYGIPEGREILLKGLKWVKKMTDEKPEEQR
ncbi:hypothetical protein [Dyadobacter luticola]|uniref:Uncharacterized protein n=1 Tax=Dyadobacter luticola TaxID=1979387 RepID=A0A5R9KSW5_9BACT|nr:hypothetical protein [Dyadobacter luticola]TLU99198.1 hypothetical protein FEN17_21730 [Dyadobacter luticola]